MDALRRILFLVKPYMGRMILAGVCSIAVSATNGSLAWLVKPAVDKVFVEKVVTFLIPLSGAIMIVFLGRGVFAFLHNYLMSSVGAKVVRDIRNRMYDHMLCLPISFIQKDSTGAMVSRVLNDAGMVQSVLTYTIKDIFVEGGTVIVLVGVALYRRWDLTLIAIVVLPLAFYFASRLGKRLKRVSERTQEKISVLTEMLAESFSGIKIIKSFCRERDEVSRFGEMNQGYYRELMRSTRITGATSLMMEFVGGVGIGFVVWYGGSLVVRGAMTAGDFFSFLTAIFLIYTPAKRLAAAQNTLQQVRAPIERVDRLLSELREEDGHVAK